MPIIEEKSDFLRKKEVGQEMEGGTIDFLNGEFYSQRGPVLPVSGTEEGQIFWQTTDNDFYVWGGVQWTLIGGSASNAVCGVVPYDYNDPSPLIIVNLEAGDRIEKVEIVVETAFDDAAASLNMGTVANPSLVFATTDTDPATTATYLNDDNFTIALNEVLKLTISPGTATQGSGYVVYSIRR